jgi:hypothetical protein
VGRRLGYPLRLVHNYWHYFARWDAEARFNIECTSRGFVSHSNEHYLQWPAPMARWDAMRLGLLQSMTRKQEAAQFLFQRAGVLRHHGRHVEAVEVFEAGCETAPGLPGCWKALRYMKALRDGLTETVGSTRTG